jgi:hypothetical protein
MHGEYKIPGGKLVVVDLDVIDGALRNVRVAGDFFLEPDEALPATARRRCACGSGRHRRSSSAASSPCATRRTRRVPPVMA